MKINTKNKNKKQARTVKHNSPGRPKYALRLPTRKEFTFQDILESNGVEIDPKSKGYGKGGECSLLTVRKGLKRDMYILHPKTKKILRVNPRSRVCLVKGVTSEPNSTTGLGRRSLVYCLRVNKDSVSKPAAKAVAPAAVKAAVAPKTTAPKAVRTPRAPKSQTPTADTLDLIHDALAAPDPVAPVSPVIEQAPVALTVPAIVIAPPVAAPEAAPVAPAPVAAESAEAATPAPVATLATS